MNLIEFTLTDEWTIECNQDSSYEFTKTINNLKKTHDVKFLHLDRDGSNIMYTIASKPRVK